MKFSAAVTRIVATGLLMVVAGSAAAQQTYPNRSIRLIVPYSPGGGTHLLSRLTGQKLGESLNQQVIVDNRPGGNTIIGAQAAARSAPDGYTIFLTGAPLVLIPLLAPTPYDPFKDFVTVATLVSTELVLVVHPSVAANNMQEFIALAKSKPGQLNYGSSGSGGSLHIVGEMFNIATGVKMQHVPYKGSGPLLADLIGGQVQLSFQVPSAAIPYIKSGRLKAIAISGEKRASALPQVPTFSEAGLPGINITAWFGIVAPAGTPKAIVDKLSAEIGRMLATPDVVEKLESWGFDPFISNSDQFAALLKADSAKFAKVIKLADIKIE